MWRYPRNLDSCCIYRVPDCIREVKPEAYTPQLVLIGPLHRPLKFQDLKALDRGDDITYTTSMKYLYMEEHKKIYLAAFAARFEGKKTIDRFNRIFEEEEENIIDRFKRIIEEEEENIRESYSESTAWIKSSEFVEMVLHDSVFIIESILRFLIKGRKKTGDRLMDWGCLTYTLFDDLILLENQLPYFILEKLFDPIVQRILPQKTLRDLIISFFNLQGKIGDDSKFRHFTDLQRCVRVETLPNHDVCIHKQHIQHAYNADCIHKQHIQHADKLESGGVQFEAVGEEFSLNVRFENGCLKMPRLMVDDRLERRLRNIMALEQCHYPFNAHVCSYIFFIEHLIHTTKAADLLVEKEIIKNRTGERHPVKQMVYKLRSGIPETGSYYSDIANEVNKYSENRVNRSKAVLKRAFFGNILSGTATIVITLLLVMTLIRTWAMVTQINQHKS
ncbi:hypothetical protein HID58_013965 [Brassica napus]|uniref:(rape) hypothetical protein n=1 Tax=Brassica napus TaxID=3708 RepID=A0A817ATY0_BRANA|nr:UPF0481 protein At3g47200-like [Brassica napus]KAH0928238.1 hypothetical protein HID58_013965 [Brassica napus]CAF2264828.1 unnamed protein product [Brassica napus]